MRASIFVLLLIASCSVEQPRGNFSCESNEDCEAVYECCGGVCQRRTGCLTCEDKDGDGFGVGEELYDCPKCRDEDLCGEDCNDNDNSIYPGASEVCDGGDNNCDDVIDEVLSCEDGIDCPDEAPFLPTCESNLCVYRAPLSSTPDCADAVACVEGTRSAPNTCF